MDFAYNAEEILEMAMQIERNGAKFYRLAAEKASNTNIRQLFHELAAMEDDHEKIFAAMKENLTAKDKEATTFDPDNQASSYLRAMVYGIIFDVKTDLKKVLDEQKTIESILKMAISFEKDSIVFYLGMKEAVPKKLGKDKIDSIITEEMGHITTLSRQLSSLQNK